MPRKPKPPEQTHIRVRIDNDLLSRLEKERAANGRTLTGEVVFRLEQSFRQQDVRKIIEDTAEATVQQAHAKRANDPIVQQMMHEYALDRLERLERRITEIIIARLDAQK
jgi:hypothetical protein